jgi:long-chain-fatty-acid--CoA ligase ACSBG
MIKNFLFLYIMSKKNSILKWNEFLKAGESVTELQLENRIKSIAPNKCATLIYTVTGLFEKIPGKFLTVFFLGLKSGTTGNPKAAMISHDNVLNMVEFAADTLKITKFADSVVSFLPLR